MRSLDITPVHQQMHAAGRRERMWSTMTVIAFVVAAGLIAVALDLPKFLQAGLVTEPPKAHATEPRAERSGIWQHYELVY